MISNKPIVVFIRVIGYCRIKREIGIEMFEISTSFADFSLDGLLSEKQRDENLLKLSIDV